MTDFDNIEIDEDTPLWMLPREIREFAALYAVLPDEVREQVRLKIDELSKKNHNNQDK